MFIWWGIELCKEIDDWTAELFKVYSVHVYIVIDLGMLSANR